MGCCSGFLYTFMAFNIFICLHSQFNAEVYCRGGFPHAAFLIADSNGFTVWHFAFPPS